MKKSSKPRLPSAPPEWADLVEPVGFIREQKRPTHTMHYGYRTEPGESQTPVLDAFFALPRNAH